MNNAEKARRGREMAERFWGELREAFGDDEVRIRMVAGDLLIPAGAVLCLVGLSLPFTWHLFDALWDETERKG